MMSPIRTGFIGLGNIGLPMAKSIVKKGLPLTIYARRKEVIEEMKSLGAAAAGSPREVAANSDIIISVVRDIPQTDEVIFGADGVWQGMKEGAIIVVASTVGIEYCRNLYNRAKERGVQVVEVGLSKSMPANEEGLFTFLVGGDEEAVKRCQPVFETMAKYIFHLGEIGTGQAYKIVNQLAVIANGIVLRECLNLGLKAGLDLQKMMDVIAVSTGSSWSLKSMDYALKSRKPLTSTLTPPVAGAPVVSIGTKDRNLALELGKKVGANTPVLQLISELDEKSVYDAYSARMSQPAH